jgi:segregation and condensation protein A
MSTSTTAVVPAPKQAEMPFAVVHGTAVTELPKDLYIPPDALEVFLEAFEGPLDLLLYLIRRQNLDVLDIPIAEITRQYVEYVELMKQIRLDLAAEYLVMAAMLAEIKARMLLPRHTEVAEEEGDPRAELVRRLQEYERYKVTAERLDELPRVGRDVYVVTAHAPAIEQVLAHPDVSLPELLLALRDVLVRVERFTHHKIVLEPLSVRERMTAILVSLSREEFVDFPSLFSFEEGRRGVVVTFLAILELTRGHLLELHQIQLFGPIRVRAAA